MVVQFAFKVDFKSAYQAMWGQKTEVSTPKVLALRPNLLQMAETSVAATKENLWKILVQGQTNANIAITVSNPPHIFLQLTFCDPT